MRYLGMFTQAEPKSFCSIYFTLRLLDDYSAFVGIEWPAKYDGKKLPRGSVHHGGWKNEKLEDSKSKDSKFKGTRTDEHLLLTHKTKVEAKF